MADDRCVVVMAEPIKGVTKVIYDQLKARKKSLWWNQGQTEEDKWFNIYKLLLPNADLPASPCKFSYSVFLSYLSKQKTYRA